MSELTLEILSGGRELTANAFRLALAGTSLWLDAGARHDRSPRWLREADVPTAVWLSHVHWDHFGALEPIRARAPRLPIFATSTTRKLAGPALKMGGVDAERADAIGSTLQRIELAQYAELSKWSDSIHAEKFRMYPLAAGHIPGAAMLLVEVDLGADQPHRVLYTGDFCCHEQPICAPALVPRGTDEFQIHTLIMEGVLATNEEADEVDVDDELRVLRAAVESNAGPVLIGAPTIGLGPEVVALLAQSGNDVVVHHSFESVLDVVAARSDWLEHVQFTDESGCASALDGGATVIAAGEQYRRHSPAARLLPEIVGREDGLVVVLNRARNNKLAGRLVRTDVGGKVPFGKTVLKKHARTHHARLPNHAPRWQMIETIKTVNPQRICLVHGHKSQLFTLRRALRKADVECDISIPDTGEVLVLDQLH